MRTLGREHGSTTWQQRNWIRSRSDELIAVAKAAIEPCDPTTLVATLTPLQSLPVSGSTHEAGEAVTAGYRIGLGDLPEFAIRRAVVEALRDTDRRWRPTPNELRGLALPHFEAAQRALRRLRKIGETPMEAAPPPPPPARLPPPMTDEERERVQALIDKYAARADARMAAKLPPVAPIAVERSDIATSVEVLLGSAGQTEAAE